MRRLLLILIVAAAGAAGGIAAWQWRESAAPRRPDFTLSDLAGKRHSASDWDGKVLLVNFWAPWCAPCRREMPMLIQLQKDYAEKGFQVLGLALDEPPAVKAFAAEMEINYPVLVGLDAILGVQETYGDTRLPFSALIDRSGRVVFRKAGELTREEMDAKLRPLLTSPPSPR